MDTDDTRKTDPRKTDPKDLTYPAGSHSYPNPHLYLSVLLPFHECQLGLRQNVTYLMERGRTLLWNQWKYYRVWNHLHNHHRFNLDTAGECSSSLIPYLHLVQHSVLHTGIIPAGMDMAGAGTNESGVGWICLRNMERKENQLKK